MNERPVRIRHTPHTPVVQEVTMIGITAYGAHIPRYRLERKRIAQAMSWINLATLGLAAGEKAVANVDEDAVTLAVAAARNALTTAPDLSPTQLFVASTTLPYLERQNSAIAAAALNLAPETETADVTGSFRSGTTALIQALRSLENGGSGGALIAAADARTAKPGSAEEHVAADAGAAVAVGTEDLLAVFRGALSLTADFPDRMRDCSQRFSRTWEERWIRDEGYLKIIPRALAAFFEKQGTDAQAYQKIAYPCPFPREHAAIAKALNIDPEEGKRALAKISSKSHRAGALNPRAHLRKPVTPEQVLKAPIIAWPLGLFDCCGVSDGAAAAIVTTPEIARSLRKDPVFVKALQIAATSGEEMLTTSWDGSYLKTTTEAAARAYAEAGIKNPRDELSILEVHDCFSITELVTYEDLGISPRGRAILDVNEGLFDLEGKIPCQSDGGLKCFGHPIGASGIRMIYEVVKQLQHKAGERQIPNPTLGLTHNLGGIPSFSVCSVSIFGL